MRMSMGAPPPLARSRRWARRLILCVVLAGVVGAVAAAGRDNIERRWQECRQRTQELLKEYEALSPSRPVLGGRDALPGNAWDEYVAGMAKFSDVDQKAVEAFVEGGVEADPAAAADIERNRAALEHMRRGARSATSLPPPPWGKLSQRDPNLVRMKLAWRALAKARSLRRDGSPAEAGGLLLDTCVFVADLGRNGGLIDAAAAHDICLRAAAGFERLLLENGLSDEECAAAASDLAALESLLPSLSGSLRGDRIWVGLELEDSTTGVGFFGGEEAVKSRWRYLYSDTLMKAEAIENFDEIQITIRRCEDLPWPEARAELSALKKRTALIRNPISGGLVPVSGGMVPKVGDWFERFRKTTARFRLIRMALAWRASRQMPELDDPFGTKLRWRDGGSGVKVWSVGPDGVDHEGDERLDEVLELQP